MGQKPIYYAAVAGDVMGTYIRWREGVRDERQLAETYSGQFFELCKRLDRKGVASFPADNSDAISDTHFEIRPRPRLTRSSGLLFHLNQWRYAVNLWLEVLRSGSSDVIVMDGVTSFYLLSPLSMMGKRVFLSIHTVLRQKGEVRSGFRRLLDRFDCWFLESHCAGCLVASPTIATQIRELGAANVPIDIFYPLYSPRDFERFHPPRVSSPFRILYAGRIEAEKGVFDLLNAVRELKAGGYDLRLDFCGEGAALETLQHEISANQLDHSVFTHGHLSRPELTALLDSCHAVVVPTRKAFPEGLNQVVIEAVLARRPVITSDVCPALRLVPDAALEAIPDDEKSYANCIRALIDDPKLMTKLVTAGEGYRDQFFDPVLAWTDKAERLIRNYNGKNV